MPVIVLAAGLSRRLGWPKQLGIYKSETLVSRSVRVARALFAGEVIVVTGSCRSEVNAALRNQEYSEVFCESFAQGVGASIGAGVTWLAVNRPESTGVLLMTCDQIAVETTHLRSLINLWQEYSSLNGQPNIVASSYDGVLGIPVIFSRHFFADLQSLPRDQGAKSLISRQKDFVRPVSCPSALVDCDTEEQCASLGVLKPG